MLFGDSVVVMVFIWIVIALAGLFFCIFVVQRIVKHYVHYPIPAFAVRFIDNPVRRRLQPPKEVVEWMGVREGMSVLEIGPGPGTFTFEAAKRVGEQGRFFAVDIQPRIISALDHRLRAKGVSNVFTGVASADDLPSSDNVFDLVFMVGVLGEVPDKSKTLLEVKRVLRDGGLLAIGEILPDPDYPRRKSVIGWCSDSGLEFVAAHGGVMHYLLTFKKRVSAK